MKAVFFGDALNARAPGVVGCLCREPDGQWITLIDVAEALKNGEEVSIRKATEGEYARAEAMVALFEIGRQLASGLCTLYGNQGDDVVEDVIFNLHQAIMSVEAPAEIFDKAAG